MNKLVEIFKAWGIAYDPNREQSELAVLRMLICNECEHKAVQPSIYCKKCYCPLEKKVFSPKVGACPIGKWNDIDKLYLENQNK